MLCVCRPSQALCSRFQRFDQPHPKILEKIIKSRLKLTHHLITLNNTFLKWTIILKDFSENRIEPHMTNYRILRDIIFPIEAFASIARNSITKNVTGNL